MALILTGAVSGEALYSQALNSTQSGSERETAAGVSDNIIRQIAERHDRAGSQVQMTLTESSNYEAGIGLLQSLNSVLESEITRPVHNTAAIQQWGDSGLVTVTQRDGLGNRAFATQYDDNQTADITQYGYRNLGAIVQSGGGNTGEIYQEGIENLGEVIQEGFLNNASMYVTGNLNAVHVHQRGDENLFNLNLEGDENFVNLTQDGDRNIYERLESGDAILNERVQQLGSDNISRQFGNLSGGRSASIIQEGNGMQLIIRHEQ